MMKSVLILDEFFAMTAKIRTLFLSHIKITNYLTLKHGTFKLRRKADSGVPIIDGCWTITGEFLYGTIE